MTTTTTTSTTTSVLRIRITGTGNNDDDNNGWIHTIPNRHVIAARSLYFEQLQGWQCSSSSSMDASSIHGLDPPIEEKDIPAVAVVAFLQALEQEDSTTANNDEFDLEGFQQTMAASVLAKTYKKEFVQRQHYYFYRLWHYFGCHQAVLENYIETLKAKERVDLLQACVQWTPPDTATAREKDENTPSNSSQDTSTTDGGLAVLLLDRLLTLPQFFDNTTKLNVPLDRTYCVSVPAAAALLRARVETAPQTDWSPANWAGWAWHKSVKTVRGGQEPDWMERLSPQTFALLTLSKFARPNPTTIHTSSTRDDATTVEASFTSLCEGWTPETVALIFQHLPPTLPSGSSPNGTSNNSSSSAIAFGKPEGMEDLVILALKHGIPLPPLIYTAWPKWSDLDLAKIALALYQSNRLEEILQFSNPLAMMQAVCRAQWPPTTVVPPERACATALLENQGGVASLIQELDQKCRADKDDGLERSRWLAQLAVFLQARQALAQTLQAQSSATGTDDSLTHKGPRAPVAATAPPPAVVASLFRCLFLRADFDPSLPPEWLGLLWLDRDRIGKRAVEQAILYLEAGIDSRVFPQLPWNKHLSPDKLVRLVRALQLVEEAKDSTSSPRSLSGLWGSLDLTAVPNSLLWAIPPPVLASHAVVHNRNLQATVAALLDRVQTLEATCQLLEREHKQTERKQKQQQHRQDQQERRFRKHEREQENHAKMETIR